jgi:hypothetical protein
LTSPRLLQRLPSEISYDQLMDIDDFWILIEESRESASNIGHRSQLLEDHLSGTSIDYIKEFHAHYYKLDLEAFTWPLWAATSVIGGYYSDQSFDNFRSWLIGCGRYAYERAVADPDTLAELECIKEIAAKSPKYRSIPEWEELAAIAETAYENITGEENEGMYVLDEYATEIGLASLGAEPPGVGWNFFDERAKTIERLPRLVRLFWHEH